MTAKPLPRTDGPEAPYWRGLKQGEIRVQCCQNCGHHRFPASRFCPVCHSDEAEWKAVAPTGTVVSYCVFHKCYFPGFASEMPYTVVQVKLDCGVQFFSNMVGTEPDGIATGMAVRAVFEPATADVTLLKFTPTGEAGA